MICQHTLITLLPMRHRKYLLDLLEDAVDEVSQLTKGVVHAIFRSLGEKEIVSNWTKNIRHRHGDKATITHFCSWFLRLSTLLWPSSWEFSPIAPCNCKIARECDCLVHSGPRCSEKNSWEQATKPPKVGVLQKLVLCVPFVHRWQGAVGSRSKQMS